MDDSLREDEAKENFRDGKRGYFNNERNPHPPGTRDYRQWRDGYDTAKRMDTGRL